MSLDYFKDEVLNQYTDAGGFITIDQNPGTNTTGNGLLHLALFCAVLKCIGLEAAILDQVHSTIASCEVKGFPGLFNRNPWKGDTDLNSWDEYFGICVLSRIYGFDFAMTICQRGVISNWEFDNTYPTCPPLLARLAAWHDRFPGLTATYKLAAGYPMVVIEKLAIALVILAHCFTRQADVCLKEWMRCTMLAEDSNIVFIAARIWLWQARRKFDTIGTMVKPYFGEGHPFSRLPWIS